LILREMSAFHKRAQAKSLPLPLGLPRPLLALACE